MVFSTFKRLQVMLFGFAPLLGLWLLHSLAPAPVAESSANVPMGNGRILTCEQKTLNSFEFSTNNSELIHSCTLDLPQESWVFLTAHGTARWFDQDYMVEMQLNANNNITTKTDRWVNITKAPNNWFGGSDKVLAASMLIQLGAGTHTFNLLGQRVSGTGTASISQPSLNVMAIPIANSEWLACGRKGDHLWESSATTDQIVTSCTLDIPQNGWVIVSADATLGINNANTPYEAQVQVGINGLGQPESSRWVNIYADPQYGTHENVASNLFQPITAGQYTFQFLAKRYLPAVGDAEMHFLESSLSVIYIPETATAATTCGDSNGIEQNTAFGNNPITVAQCTFTTTQPSKVLVMGSASLGLVGNTNYEGLVYLSLGNSFDKWHTGRIIDVYPDDSDGTDKTAATSFMLDMPAGTHTAKLLGEVFEGGGTMRVYDPTLIVIAIPDGRVFLPFVQR